MAGSKRKIVEEPVSIELSADEAVVFIDWLWRFNKQGGHTFEDQAEQRVLWNIEARMEKKMVAPLRPDYQILIAKARAQLRDKE
jgi:hypothetical protein